MRCIRFEQCGRNVDAGNRGGTRFVRPRGEVPGRKGPIEATETPAEDVLARAGNRPESYEHANCRHDLKTSNTGAGEGRDEALAF